MTTLSSLSQPTIASGRSAIVMGGSMAGLLAARVLCDHFETVTLLERDSLASGDAYRKGVPQGQQPHALLSRGYAVLSGLFPDLPLALRDGGAVFVEMGAEMRWYHAGGYRVQTPMNLCGPFMSRPFLERLVRERVLSRPNLIAIPEGDIRGLLTDENGSRVIGARAQRRDADSEETLFADLTVDATGRGSRTPAWLGDLGYASPQEETIAIHAGYTTLIYERAPDDVDAKAVYVTPTPPQEKRFGALFPIEGNRWLATLGGWLGHHAPANLAGFLEFARSLPVPDIYNVIARKRPISDFMRFKYPANRRRRYERLRRFPEGLLVVGDALCSFNPIYGQGMTASALVAMTLEACLRECGRIGSLDGLWQRFFPLAARQVDTPWQIAAGADFQYPEVVGPQSLGTDLINAYMRRVQRATHHDPVVYRAFARVMHLLDEPKALLSPRIARRALWPARRDVQKGSLRQVSAAEA